LSKHSNNNSIETVMARLLTPAGLGEQQLSTTLGSVMRGGVDYADLYFQVSRHESWTLEDGIIREGSFSLDQGVGVRATSGEKTGFAYSDELVLPALEKAAGAARAIARQGQDKQVQAWRRDVAAPLYPLADPTASIDDAQKAALLLEIDSATRDLDKRVEQVIVSLASSQDLVLVAASDGTMAADIRPLVRLNVSVILEQDGQREQGFSGGGARTDLHYFIDSNRPMEFAAEEACACRHDARRPGAGLARSVAARGGGSRAGRRFQSERRFRLQWQGRTKGGIGTLHNRGRWHHREPARVARRR